MRRSGRTVLPRSVLASPLEQQVGVDAMFKRELRHRNPRCARSRRKLSFEFGGAIRAALTAWPTRPCCSHSGLHYSSGGYHFGSSPRYRKDGLRMTLTARNDRRIEDI